MTTSISLPAPTTRADSRADDTQCANCHIPQGETAFDASIMGAHVVATDTAATYPQNPDTLLAGINLAITSVTNTTAGQKPTVNFTCRDDKGNNIPLSKLGLPAIHHGWSTTDYGYTSFGSDTASTPGYVTESAAQAACSSSGDCTYTFTHAIPAAATGDVLHRRRGTHARDGAGRHNHRPEQSVKLGAKNLVVNFSVDGSAVRPAAPWWRSPTAITVTSRFPCTAACATTPSICVLCHNPSNTDASNAPPPWSRRQSASRPGHQFQSAGSPHSRRSERDGQRRQESLHRGGLRRKPQRLLRHALPGYETYGRSHLSAKLLAVPRQWQRANLPIGLNPVTDPQGWINPVSGRNLRLAADATFPSPKQAHFLANTNSLGESCTSAMPPELYSMSTRCMLNSCFRAAFDRSCSWAAFDRSCFRAAGSLAVGIVLASGFAIPSAAAGTRLRRLGCL